MNEGAKVAKGEILLFLHADTQLPPHALELITEVLSDHTVIGGSFCLAFDHCSPVLKLCSLCSRINHALFTYGDQGLFLRASTFREVGGFMDIPIMEDVEMQRRLRSKGKFAKLRTPVVTSARRYKEKGVLRQQILNTMLVAGYLAGVPPAILKRFYSDSREGSGRRALSGKEDTHDKS